MAKFDIIIPVYNTSFYLKKCLDSVLNQTYKDFHIIIVDDKSTDNSLSILRKYQESFPQYITLIENSINMGVGEARNIALRLASAEYITFLDSDDILDLNILEKVNTISNLYDPDIIVSNIQMNFHNIKPNFLMMKRESNNENRLICPLEEKKHIYMDRPAVTSKFFKKEIIKTEFPINLKWEDYPFVIPYLATSKSIYYLKDIGYYYNVNPLSTTVSDIIRFSPKVLDIFTGTDIINSTIGSELCEYYKNELRIVRTMNCLNRVRDLCFSNNITQVDKILLVNYLTNLINIREGDYQELEYYHHQKNISPFYQFRMDSVESLIDSSLQKETDEERLKLKIKIITKKYEK